MLKSQLEQEISRLQGVVEVLRDEKNKLKEQDETVRKEFAEAFDWTHKKGSYTNEMEVDDVSWSQIFIRLGRLLAKSDRGDRMSELIADVQFLKERDNSLTYELSQIKKQEA